MIIPIPIVTQAPIILEILGGEPEFIVVFVVSI
jgi:hypothetical protein